MKNIKIKLIGESALLQSCDRLVNPLDSEAIRFKKLNAVPAKNRTEEQILEISKCQFVNSLYWRDGVGVVMPTINIKKALEQGAKMVKKGPKVRGATMIFDEYVKLAYGEEKPTRDALWADAKYRDVRSVVQGGKQRVMSYKPRFNQWSCEVTITYDPAMLSGEEIIDHLTSAGKYIGIGSFRPEKNGPFGRFTVKEAK